MACSAVEVVDMNIYSLRTKDSGNLIKPSNDGRLLQVGYSEG